MFFISDSCNFTHFLSRFQDSPNGIDIVINVFKTLQDLGGYKDLVVVLLSHLQGELMNFVEAE